jgi:phenylacetate-CoA ligase
MSVVPAIKRIFQSVPWPIGGALAHLDYQYRPGFGGAYREFRKNADQFEQKTIQERKEIVFREVQKSLGFASDILFYQDLFKSNGLSISDIRKFEDISQLPIVTKDMLRDCDLELRSRRSRNRYIANTGGTSGTPLHFYITPKLIPREWAHMHKIWEKLGYSQRDLKVVFSGRDLAERAVAYDGLRHSYLVNAYLGFAVLERELGSLVKKRKIKFLHGYPSAIYEFARNISVNAPDILRSLKRDLRGIFFGSEYPPAVYRSFIEKTFGVPSVSWYGHTERCVLAWEKSEPYVYHPFQTYGYVEAVKNESAGTWRLVATSYLNDASPLIRYDTGDEIEPVIVEGGLLKAFRITGGRTGDFVTDKAGVKISLTALIFGRHHKLFEIAKFVQVSQPEAGAMIVHITPQSSLPSPFKFESWFDTRNLNMDITYRILDRPILTPAGKVALKVN